MTGHLGRARFDDLVTGSAQTFDPPPGLDPRLVTAPPVPGFPLVWFGLCDPPRAVAPLCADVAGPRADRGSWAPQWTASSHRSGVRCVRERIGAGDVYQCNLTSALTSTAVADPFRLYTEMALAQAGSTAAYLDIGSHVIASASLQLFLEWVGDTLRTRPMKGTAPRGRSCAEDDQRARGLRASEKERAENLMIVDLLRNDLAKVSRIGSVEVSSLFAVERLPSRSAPRCWTARPG